MKIAEIMSKFYMSDWENKELRKKWEKLKKEKKNKEYDCTYYGVPCKVINSRKIMREIEFKDGSTTTAIYNEINS